MKKIVLSTCLLLTFLITKAQKYQFQEPFVKKVSEEFCEVFNDNETEDFELKFEQSIRAYFLILFTRYETELIEIVGEDELSEATGRKLGEELMSEINKYLIVDCKSYSDNLKAIRNASLEEIFEPFRTQEFLQSYRNLVNSPEFDTSKIVQYSAGVIAFANGDYIQGTPLIEKSINRNNIEAIHLLAYVYEQSGLYDKAIELYNSLPENNQINLYKGLIQRSKKEGIKPKANKRISTNAHYGLWESFETNLIRKIKSPQEFEVLEPEKDGIKLVNYQSGELSLKGLINTKNIEKGKKKPAIVYLHGGFALGYSDVTDCHPFTDAGYIVFAPSYRGESGNDGNFELLKGEVDDAKAAIEWLKQQPYIDAENISVFGHSIGGGMALTLSLHPDLGIKKLGGVAGLYDTSIFESFNEGYGVEIPFDINKEEELLVRLAVNYLENMEREHFLYIGTDDNYEGYRDWVLDIYENEIPKRLKMIEVEGNHFTSLLPSMKLFLKELEK